MHNITFELKKEFYWAYEATCFIRIYLDGSMDELKKKYETDENYADFLSGPFHNLESYFQAILDEVKPCLNASPLLSYYGQKTEDGTSLLTEIVRSIPMQEFESLTVDAFRIYVFQAIASELSDISNDDAPFIFNAADEIPPALTSLTTLLESLSLLSLEDSDKMKLVNLYLNYEKLFVEFKNFVEQMVPLMKKHFSLIEKDIARAENESLSQAYIDEILFNSSLISIQTDGCMIVVLPSIFNYNSFSLHMRADSRLITVGYLIKPLMDLNRKKQFEKTHQLLKALGDPTRLRIMQCLAKRKMYTQELARELKLTPATISHHLTTLFQAEAITVFVDETNAKKVLYEVNKETLETLKLTLTDLQG